MKLEWWLLPFEMKNTLKVLRLLRGVVRLLGFAPHDDEGSLTLWYAVTLIYRFVILSSKGLYWYSTITRGNPFYKSRPFQYMIVVLLSLVDFGSWVCHALPTRFPLTFRDFNRLELYLKREIDYDMKFIAFDIIMLPCVKLLHTGITVYGFVSGHLLNISQAAVIGITYLVPGILSYVGNMYYCGMMQVLRRQLYVLRRARLHPIQSAFLHTHLTNCCNRLHRHYSYQIIFGIVGSTISVIFEGIFAHERLVSFIMGDAPIYLFLLTTFNIVFVLLHIGNIVRTCQTVESEVKYFIDDLFIIQHLKQGGTSEKILKAYILSQPKFNPSVGGFFEARMSLLITIMSSTLVNYALMVQMNVIKHKFNG